MVSAHNDYISSDEDDDESSSPFSSSVAFLGFIDAPITEEDGPTIDDSFVGGQPIWFHVSSPPPSDMLLCKVCNAPMALLSQSFAPLDDTLYDRVIYVLTCKSPSCRRKKGSIRAIRAIKKDPAAMKKVEEDKTVALQAQIQKNLKLEEQKKTEAEVTNNIFDTSNSTSNPFNTGSSNPFAANPFNAPEKSQSAISRTSEKPTFASVAQKAAAKSTDKEDVSKKQDIKLKEFPGYFIYVEEEKFRKNKRSNSNDDEESKLRSKIEQLDESVLDTEFDDQESSSRATKSENPDSSRIASMLDDPVFGHFSDIISHNSHQVLRYDLGGSPLFYSSKDDVYKLFHNKDKEWKIPNPGYNPSSRRQFEFQLMPKLIMDLEKDTSDILNGMEWGTIIVCTDVEDFVPKLDANNVGYVEEWCGVQWEEEVKR